MARRACKLFVLLGFFLVALPISARQAKPYYIKGQVSIASGGEYSLAGLDIEVYNKSGKAITSFAVVFRLYDADGFSPFDDDYATVEIEEEVMPHKSIKTCISLDDLLDEAPDEGYGVEALFVERITYDDGSVWSESPAD